MKQVRIAELKKAGVTPGLATVLVGEDPASQMYVGMKSKAAQELGLYSRQISLPADAPEAQLLGVVAGLNADPSIHGILRRPRSNFPRCTSACRTRS